MQKQEFIRRFRRGYPHKTTCHTQLEDVMPSFGGIQTNKNLFAIVVWPKTPLCWKEQGQFQDEQSRTWKGYRMEVIICRGIPVEEPRQTQHIIGLEST
jgi:hypothetical protein